MNAMAISCRYLINAGMFALGLAVCGNTMGCAAIASMLPTVLEAVTDAAQILDAIEKFVAGYFVAHPDPEAQAKANKALAKARGALNVALRATHGVDNLTQEKVDDAFSEFKLAYQELLGIVGPLGVHPQGDRMQATPGGLAVPTPLALGSKVRR